MTPTIGDSSSMVTSWSLILCQPGTVDFTTASSITGIAHAIFILIFRDAVDSFSRNNAYIFGIVSYLYSQIFFLILKILIEMDDISSRLDTHPVEMIVQDRPEPPPHRPMISSISSRSVLLTWAVPLHDNHDPIISYRILVRKDDNNTVEEIDTGLNETKFLVTGLQPFTTYSFRVSAHNSIGISDPSKESFHTQTHRESK